MSTVSVTITGILWDHANKSGKPVTLVGDAYLSGLGVGGGPVYPDQQPPSGGPPGTPTFPIWGPPGFNPPGAGYPPGISGGPIVPVPPSTPNVPPPGSPPVMVSGTQPVNPMTPPPAVIIEYPGVGKVVVPQPTQSGPAPQ